MLKCGIIIAQGLHRGIFHVSIYARYGYIDVMTEATFWILTVLAGGRQHGYAILRDVERLTASEVSLRVSTLYATLDRLERDGSVCRAGDETVDGRARRYYELTADGRQALLLETERLAARLRVAESQLAPPRPASSRPVATAMAWGYAG